MATATQTDTEQFYEYCDSRTATIAVEEGILKGVKLLGPESKNGRLYPKETMVRAVSLYEGAKVNVDHPAGNPNTPRSYSDRIGVIRNARAGQADSGIFGDFHFNPKHPLAEQLAWDAAHSPENVGFSHNVHAATSQRDGRTVVEEIKRVTSVDLVADPATTRGLFEGDQSTAKEVETMAETTVTVKSLAAEHPQIVEAISASAVKAFTESEGHKAKDAELTELREQVQKFTAADALRARSEAVEKAIAEAKLPTEIVTETLRQTLLEATDERRTALIADLKAISARAAGKPRSKEQTTQAVTEGKSLDVDDPAAIRRDAGYRVDSKEVR